MGKFNRLILMFLPIAFIYSNSYAANGSALSSILTVENNTSLVIALDTYSERKSAFDICAVNLVADVDSQELLMPHSTKQYTIEHDAGNLCVYYLNSDWGFRADILTATSKGTVEKINSFVWYVDYNKPGQNYDNSAEITPDKSIVKPYYFKESKINNTLIINESPIYKYQNSYR